MFGLQRGGVWCKPSADFCVVTFEPEERKQFLLVESSRDGCVKA